MTIDVNLLPESYRQAQRHEQWFQQGTTIGVVLIAVELGLGLLLYVSAGEKRDLQADVQEARNTLRSHQQEYDEMTRQATLVTANVALAKELRASHRWSRLLAALADATPDGVVLTAMSTDPPRWSSAGQNVTFVQPIETRGAGLDSRFRGNDGTTPGQALTETRVKSPIKGVLLRGYAVDYQGLSLLMTKMHASGMFAALDLQRMQRDQFQGREAISFELQGRW